METRADQITSEARSYVRLYFRNLGYVDERQYDGTEAISAWALRVGLCEADITLALLRGPNKLLPDVHLLIGKSVKKIPYGPMVYADRVREEKKSNLPVPRPIRPGSGEKLEVIIKTNPYREGSKGAHMHAIVKTGMTAEEWRARGAARKHIARALRKGWVRRMEK